jgi:hypothetical protein
MFFTKKREHARMKALVELILDDAYALRTEVIGEEQLAHIIAVAARYRAQYSPLPADEMRSLVLTSCAGRWDAAGVLTPKPWVR